VQAEPQSRPLVRAVTRKRILVVVNPIASSVSARLRTLMISALSSRFEVVEAVTDAKGHARQLASDAADQGIDAVVTFGGDGTANEAANGLLGTDVPLTCLPGGSANVYCGVTGTPRDLAGAVNRLLGFADAWETRAVDTGTVNGERFLFNSGVGLDAAVLEGVDARPDLKRKWRQWWFVTEAARTLAADYKFSPPTMRLTGRETATGIAIVVQNGRPWTYFGKHPMTVSTTAAVDTGKLTATVVQRPRPWDYPSLAWRAFSGQGVDGHPRLTIYDEESFKVVPLDGQLLDIHVDGDHIGRFDRAEYRIDSNSMQVLG